MPHPLAIRQVPPMWRTPRAWLATALLAAPLLSCASDHVTAPGIRGELLIYGPDSLAIGDTATLHVQAFDAHGREIIPTPPLAWISQNPAVATVSLSGQVTAVGGGGTLITARSDSLVGTHLLNVAGPQLALVPLPEFGDTIRLAPGQTFRLFAFEYDSAAYHAILPSGPVSWLSSQAGVASVNDSGVVAAIAPGVVQVTASAHGLRATRTFKIAPTPGTATVRLVNASDTASHVTLVAGAGPPVALAYLGVAQQSVPAGTLQILAPAYPPTADTFDWNWLDAQQFAGFLPSGSGATFVIASNRFGGFAGPIVLAPLWDWGKPVSPDSVMLRVVLATNNGYNVYYTDPGADINALALRGCYLDFPYGANDYSARRVGTFDIVLQRGKDFTDPPFTRVTVTPAPGRATTYVITGESAYALSVITLVDP